MTSFQLLDEELARWSADGRTATLWWRDDDAAEPCPALDRLLDLARGQDLPLSLAVIPKAAGLDLAACLSDEPTRVTVLQHGYAHLNHAPPSEKKQELGAHRPLEAIAAELTMGREHLIRLFPDRFLPVLVPPWNRIDPGLADRLAGLGFSGLSCFGQRPSARDPSGLPMSHCQVDLFRWRPHRAFLGSEAICADIATHLKQRRGGDCDPREPTGIMTHHLVHDEVCWDFLQRLFDHLNGAPAAEFLSAKEVFSLHCDQRAREKQRWEK